MLKTFSPSFSLPLCLLLKNISNLASNRRKWELRWMHSKNVSCLATRSPSLHTHIYTFSHFKPFTRFASVLNISLGCTVCKMAGVELWPDQPVGCDIQDIRLFEVLAQSAGMGPSQRWRTSKTRTGDAKHPRPCRSSWGTAGSLCREPSKVSFFFFVVVVF